MRDIRAFVFILLTSTSILSSQSLYELQKEFIDLRFGVFFHFGIMTFTGDPWATPHQDISKFNPADMDCNQWADAASKAKMKFAILTTKHHDGFCLWDSKYTDYDVASTPWENGKGDVLREFVDAFRNKGIEPCFYYSVWDNTHGIGNKEINRDDIEFIKGQLTELLTNYGKIKLLFIDGWSWKMGHRAVPYDEIRELVKKLQPECLLIDNTHIPELYHNDLIHFETAVKCPSDNRLPGMQSMLINKSGGNDWFWSPDVATAPLLTADEILESLDYLEKRWSVFVLNCPPNNKGLIDSSIVERLSEIGEKWEPDFNRPPLPEANTVIEHPVVIKSAEAESGNADFAVDGINDRYYYSYWESDSTLPQSIIFDLGKNYDLIQFGYLPKYTPVVQPDNDGSITSYVLYASKDKIDFDKIAEGNWMGDHRMKVIRFPAVNARYLKLVVNSAVNNRAIITEALAGKKK
jgi:alpha-L-fucosidase